MIVNAALQPVTNDSVYWLPCDTEQLYNENLSTPSKKVLLEKYNWIGSCIEYKFNSEGFRSQEFKSDAPAIAVFGCSHTQGIGLPYNQLWHQHLANRLNKSVFNFGIGGASADTCYRLAEHYLPLLNIDTVVMLTPSETRLEFWHTADSFPWFMNVHSVPDDHKFFMPWYIDPRNANIYATKNIQSVAYICQMLGIDFYCYRDLDFLNCTTTIDYARDLLHRGETNHIKFAEIVYNDIDFKRVYQPQWLNRAQPPRS